MYPIGYLFRRNDKIWVFGGYNGFSDNTRYLFETINTNDEVRNIWISEDKKTITWLRENGYEAYQKNSIKGLYYGYRAKVYIYSNYVSTINFYTSGGAVLVNLWHGTPLKKIEYDIEKKPLFSYFKGANIFVRALLPENHIRCNIILAPSDFVYNYSFRSAFRVFNRKDVIVADPPRISSLISNYSKPDDELFKNGKVKRFLYAPTWRDNRSDFISISGVDFYELDKFLKLNNVLLDIRLHPNTRLNIDSLQLNNISIINNDETAEKSMLNADFMITDYSSIYFDYLYLNRPIIFFPFDLYEYTACRELYLDYNEVTPGAKVFTQNQLMVEMKKVINGDDEWSNRRAEMARRFCSLERRDDSYIIDKIKEYIDDNK